ncbi:MAG: alginate O-acetyltransferase AlgF [Candidatus Competibacteraceae bacterium]
MNANIEVYVCWTLRVYKRRDNTFELGHTENITMITIRWRLMYTQLFLGLMIWFALGLAVAFAFGAVAAQQDADVCNPSFPPGSAFIRVANATVPGQLISVRLADYDFGELDYADLSLYRQVCEGQQFFQVGNQREQLTIAAGNFYTLTVRGQGEHPQVLLVKDAVSPAESETPASIMTNQTMTPPRAPKLDVDLDDDYLDHVHRGVA